MDPASDRRAFLALAGAAAAGLAACGEEEAAEKAREGLRPPGPEQDARLLSSLIEHEHTLVAAYAAGARELSGARRARVRALAAQEREHARRLGGVVRSLDRRPPRPKSAREYSNAFPRLESGADALRLALDLESLAIVAYTDALPKLSSARLRRLAASILTNEAQHAALVRESLGEPPVGAAFVTGK